MRVVAGSAGGIRLTSPRSDLRPTMDRVKGAIFSSLAELVPGSHVLDLFAGTGALGIEALSRGAARAVFIDHDARAIAAIRENLARTGHTGEVIRAGVASWVRRPGHGVFQLIFADPPYRKNAQDEDLAAQLLAEPNLPGLLAEEGVLVIEHAPAQAFGESDLWQIIRSRTYGSTTVSFFSRNTSR